MHLLMNMYPWYLPKRNREWLIHFELMHLRDQFPDMTFSLVNSIPSMALGNGVFAFQYLLGRTGRYRQLLSKSYGLHVLTSMNWVPQRFIRHSGADLFFGHEYFPVNITEDFLPTIFETGMQSDSVIEFFAPRKLDRDEYVRGLRSMNVRMKRHIAARCTLINVREPSGAERFRSLLPEYAEKVRTVYPYLDYLEPISETELITKQKKSDVCRILFVGNQANRKGLPFVVRAIQNLPSDVRGQFEFIVVSQFLDGRVDLSNVEVQLFTSKKPSNLELVFGHKLQKQGALSFPEVIALMRSSDVFVLPTLADTFGFVFLEAMASGCAVVGPARDPQDWILDYGRAGMLVEPTDPDSIAEAIYLLVKNPELRLALALAGRQRFLLMYYHRVVGQQYRDLFEEAIDLWHANKQNSQKNFGFIPFNP
jgi:glycosyltransferase involved in cell wall biosynthesis